MNGRPRLLSNYEVSVARSMRASGAPQHVIAKRLNVGQTTISRVLRTGYKQPERRW